MSKERNDEICRLYVGGLTLEECGQQFDISRERARQVLRKAGVFRKDRHFEPRDKFLGVSVPSATKEWVTEEAERQGTSASRLTTTAIEEMRERVEAEK